MDFMMIYQRDFMPVQYHKICKIEQASTIIDKNVLNVLRTKYNLPLILIISWYIMFSINI